MTTRIINNKSRAWYLTLWHLSILKTNGYIRKTTTDQYVDGLILRDGDPLLWQFDGGYVSLNANGAATCWNYYVTDHLGSTRKVVDSNNNIKETINYYPFGSEMRMQDPAQIAGNTWQPYRFTGKELDNQNGLNWYDFGARLFDVAGVPMWTSVDPLAEKYYPYSPYTYCENDPIKYIDPTGMESEDLENNNSNERKKTVYSAPIEKPLETVHPEFYLITAWRLGANMLSLASDMTKDGLSLAISAKEKISNSISSIWNKIKPETSGKRSFDEILQNSNFDKITKGNTRIYRKEGDATSAEKDFRSMQLDHVNSFETQYGKGLRGKGENNIEYKYRPGSSNGEPTIEMSKNNRTKIKIRYDSK